MDVVLILEVLLISGERHVALLMKKELSLLE
jgi:hypothetical protein